MAGFYEDWLKTNNGVGGTNVPLATPQIYAPPILPPQERAMPPPAMVPSQEAVQRAANRMYPLQLVSVAPTPHPPYNPANVQQGAPAPRQAMPAAVPPAGALQWQSVPIAPDYRVATPATHPGNWSAGMPEAYVALPPGAMVPDMTAQNVQTPGQAAAYAGATNSAMGRGIANSGILRATAGEVADLQRMRGHSGQQGPAERQYAARNAAEQRLQEMQASSQIAAQQAQQTPQAVVGKGTGGGSSTWNPNTQQWTTTMPEAKTASPYHVVPGVGLVNTESRKVEFATPTKDTFVRMLPVNQEKFRAINTQIAELYKKPFPSEEDNKKLKKLNDDLQTLYIDEYKRETAGGAGAHTSKQGAETNTIPLWQPGA